MTKMIDTLWQTRRPQYSREALDLFDKRGIDAALAYRHGVHERNGNLYYPNGRQRSVVGGSHRQPPGQPLNTWWFGGTADTALICEGETDALAARSAIPSAPVWVAAVPGASFPPERLAREAGARGIQKAFLLPDGDEAGRRFAERVGSELKRRGITTRVAKLPAGQDLAHVLACLTDRAAALRSLLIAAVEVPETKIMRRFRSNQYEGSIKDDDLRKMAAEIWIERLTGEQVPDWGKMRCPLPDHDDRTPSFQVYPTSFNCFGCNRGGSIYDFAMYLWECDFRTAQNRLGEVFGD